ncbi:MAG: hypothetical protein M3Q48_12475, partial [Actinomycetota bacterium]|nr:hypothetical protein [Actinomycetota bacterium]
RRPVPRPVPGRRPARPSAGYGGGAYVSTSSAVVDPWYEPGADTWAEPGEPWAGDGYGPGAPGGGRTSGRWFRRGNRIVIVGA